MIYINGNVAGRNVYTTLDNVLGININKVNQQMLKQRDGYENLEKTVNQNYKNFSENMIMKQNPNKNLNSKKL